MQPDSAIGPAPKVHVARQVRRVLTPLIGDRSNELLHDSDTVFRCEAAPHRPGCFGSPQIENSLGDLLSRRIAQVNRGNRDRGRLRPGAAFAVLLYPGLRTPLEAVPELVLPDPAPDGREPEGLDVRLASFVADLPAADKRALAQALRAYSAGSPPAVRPPRDLHGSSSAPVRITEFTDTLCGHCARFHEGLEALERALPDSFSFEERHFPLDVACNRAGPSRGPGVSVRCRAALARICMEGKPNALDYSGDLFRSQDSLTAERVLALAAPYAEPEKLAHCMASAATLEKLRDDIDWALEHRIRGTPLVLVNGRAAPASPTFLYALILSRGDADHTAFQALSSAETVER